MERSRVLVGWCTLALLIPACVGSPAVADQEVQPTAGGAIGSAVVGTGPFTLEDAASVRQPRQPLLSADASHFVYLLGDTLWIRSLGRDGRSGPRRAIAGDVTNVGSYDRPFVAMTPDARRLVVRTGSGGVHEGGVPLVAELHNEGGPRPLLPDSLVQRLQTFRHWAAGGPAWSPDGSRLAFLAADTTQASSDLQVYVVRWPEGQVAKWTDDDAMKYSVAFSPDGRWLAVATGRGSKEVATVSLFDVDEGAASRAVIAEGPDRYYHDLLWAPGSERLLAQSASYSPLLLELDGDGEARPVDVALPTARYRGWTPDGEALLTIVREGMRLTPAIVRIDDGRKQLLTREDAVVRPVGVGGSPARSILLYSRETGEEPRDLWAAPLSAAAGALATPSRVTDANPGLAPRIPAEVRIHSWKAEDGTELQGQLFLPRGRSGPFPLVVIPYGSFSADFPRSEYFLELGILPLVSRGWAVVRPNTRGRASDSSPVGQYGKIQLIDTSHLLSDLTARHLIDPERVAVVGHSHGGSLAYYFAAHSDQFCAVTAINGRADWTAQAEYGDPYLVQALGGSPDEVPHVYAAGSPVEKAGDVSAALLAIAGRKDTQILPSNAEEMVRAVRTAGGEAELIVFEEAGHLFPEPGERRAIWERIFDLLYQHCADG